MANEKRLKAVSKSKSIRKRETDIRTKKLTLDFNI